MALSSTMSKGGKSQTQSKSGGGMPGKSRTVFRDCQEERRAPGRRVHRSIAKVPPETPSGRQARPARAEEAMASASTASSLKAFQFVRPTTMTSTMRDGGLDGYLALRLPEKLVQVPAPWGVGCAARTQKCAPTPVYRAARAVRASTKRGHCT